MRSALDAVAWGQVHRATMDPAHAGCYGVGFAWIFQTASATAAETSPASPEVSAALQPYLDQHKLAGYVAVVADRTGRVRYRNILGYDDVEARKPISGDNVFWIASMSKMFAGASIMMLVPGSVLTFDSS